MKLFTIKLEEGKFVVNDYYTKLPTPPYDNKAHAIEVCRLRLERSIYEVLYQFKVPFIGLWLVW